MKERLRKAARPALIHLAFVAALIALLTLAVCKIWYPFPYYEILGATRLIGLFALISIFCGPLLTWVLFDPAKDGWKQSIDILLIIVIQVCGIGYGLYYVIQARPVLLAFEGDRFRIVRAVDVVFDSPQTFAAEPIGLSWSGPRLIGVKLLKSTDPGYVASLTLAMQGIHPAFRSSRWKSYSATTDEIINASKPASRLSIDLTLVEKNECLGAEKGRPQSLCLGYLPLVQDAVDDWVVIIGLKDGLPKAFRHVDGW